MKSKFYIRAIGLQWLIFLLPAAICAQGIQITPGAHMVVNGNVNLVLQNAGITTNGHFSAGHSTLILSGENPAQSWIGGSTAASFHKIVINRKADVILNGHISVNDTLKMIKGNLQLNKYTLDLNGYITGENNLSSVTGTTGGVMRVTTKLRAPHEVNPGNIGVEITTLSNPGTTVIERRHERQTLLNGGQSIQRYFQIRPATNSNLNATLRFFYLDKELAGIDEAAISLWKGADLGNYWLFDGGDSVNKKANYIVKTGIDHFTRYTVGVETKTEKMARVAGAGLQSEPLSSTMQVYPNPLQQQFTIAFHSGIDKEYTISLYDQAGHWLQSKKLLSRKGAAREIWNMTGYSRGIYYLVCEGRSIKLIKK
ncbi:T9SS type A sorting domain-containing protein [Niastella populi]|nr:T9SS type A sorting domain-containing protein [Niastella populi]